MLENQRNKNLQKKQAPMKTDVFTGAALACHARLERAAFRVGV